MALQSIKGGLWIPSPSEGNNTGVAFTTASTLTANTHRSAFVFQVPKTGSIHKLHWRYGAVTSGGTTRMQTRLEPLGSTTGDPTGAAYGGCAYGTSSIQPVSNTYDVITLGTDATATKGDFVAACIDFQTFNASDSVIIQSGGTTAESAGLGYVDTFGASWAKTGGVGLLGVEYSDGSTDYIPNTTPYTAITNTSFNSTTGVTDEYALSFQIPFPARVAGVAMNLGVAAATQNYEIILYSGTSALQTITGSHRAYQTSSQRLGFWIFPTPQTISANTLYRLSIRPTSSTNVTLQIYTYNSAAMLDQDEGGQNFCLATRLDQGAWAADTTTQRPAIYIMFDQFDDAVSAGGVKVHPGMDGGCRA